MDKLWATCVAIDTSHDERWDFEVFWKQALKELHADITDQEYETWFSSMAYDKSRDAEIVVTVPSSFYRDQVSQRYLPKLEAILLDLTGRRLKVTFHVARRSPKRKRNDRPAAPQPRKRPRHPQLNPTYNFERFVEGENNSFALNAAIAIAKNPGRAYNPCLVYGGVGLGKTHLVQAIGNTVHETMEDLKVVYVTVETFTNEFIQSIQQKTGHRFKAKYRSADVLLIDDIQFLSGKTETQQELFHTFNALYDANKQMVFTSDRPVSDLSDLPDRLINRFERGLNVDLQPPNFETRTAILNRKIEEYGVAMPNDVVTLIGENIRTNVRDIEKALTKLIAYSELVNRTITLDIANRELKEFFSQPAAKNISTDVIQRVVADYFGLSQNDLKGKKRTKAIAFPRQVAMYLVRELTEFSTTEVGLEFGGRDHTTVMHACQKVAERLRTDATLEPIVDQLIRTIRNQQA